MKLSPNYSAGRWRQQKKNYDEINRLRQRYRIADGDEAELVSEIKRLSALCDYPASANKLLFEGDASAIYWGFGCWKIEMETGKTTRQLLREKEKSDAGAASS